jgi:ferritin-like protein
MASEGFHESLELLQPATLERHRAIVSLREELEAVDWYDQRVDATTDPDLRRVLEHNRDEEKEHAAMTLEWLRRHDAALDAQLREWLFSDAPLGSDGDAPPGEATGSLDGGSLGIGSLYGKGTL